MDRAEHSRRGTTFVAEHSRVEVVERLTIRLGLVFPVGKILEINFKTFAFERTIFIGLNTSLA